MQRVQQTDVQALLEAGPNRDSVLCRVVREDEELLADRARDAHMEGDDRLARNIEMQLFSMRNK